MFKIHDIYSIPALRTLLISYTIRSFKIADILLKSNKNNSPSTIGTYSRLMHVKAIIFSKCTKGP